MAKVTKGPTNRVWLLCRPFGDLSHVWLCYVGPLVIIAMFGYVIKALW